MRGHMLALQAKRRYGDDMTKYNLVSTRKAAEVLGVHPRSVNRMVDRGRMYPAAVVDRGRVVTYVFEPSEVERVREQREAGIK